MHAQAPQSKPLAPLSSPQSISPAKDQTICPVTDLWVHRHTGLLQSWVQREAGFDEGRTNGKLVKTQRSGIQQQGSSMRGWRRVGWGQVEAGTVWKWFFSRKVEMQREVGKRLCKKDAKTAHFLSSECAALSPFKIKQKNRMKLKLEITK